MKADRKAKVKERAKVRTQQKLNAAHDEKVDFLYHEARWFVQNDQFDKAILLMERALRLAPDNIEMIRFLGYLGHESQRADVERKALSRLWHIEALPDEFYPPYINLMLEKKRFDDALAVCPKGLARLAGKRFKGVAARCQFFQEVSAVCRRFGRAAPAPPVQPAKSAKSVQPAAQRPSSAGRAGSPRAATGRSAGHPGIDLPGPGRLSQRADCGALYRSGGL